MILNDPDPYMLDELLPDAVLSAIYGENESNDKDEKLLPAVAVAMCASGFDVNDTWGVLSDPVYPLALRNLERHSDGEDRLMAVVIEAEPLVDLRGIDAVTPTAFDLYFDLDRHDDLSIFAQIVCGGECLVYQATDSVYMVRGIRECSA